MTKLKALIKKILLIILHWLPLRNIVLLESVPEFTDNTWAVYQELRRLEKQKHFKCIWIGRNHVIVPKGVRYVNKEGSKADQRRWWILQNTAKVMVSCNSFYLEPIRKGQLSLFLTHGSPLKTSPSYSYENRFHYVLSQSHWLTPYVAKENSTDICRILSLGIPRNDALYHPDDALEKLNYIGYSKVIAWLPTYRQHNNGNITDMPPSPMGLPVFQTPEDVKRLNEALRDENALLVIKPHPAQNISLLQEVAATNITFLDNDLLHRADVELYSFLGATDAMITDYSSVYYDYLLTRKPIGLTLDDLDAYIAMRGFVYENVRDILKGTEILNMDDLISFVNEVSLGLDPHREERDAVDALVNEYHDDQSSSRAAAFILRMLEGDAPPVPETQKIVADPSSAVRVEVAEQDKTEKYLFSVVTAVYMVEAYLAEAVESIIHQDIGFEHIQLILVDDGSPDNSGRICDEYAKKYPDNIVVIHKENGGVSSARNMGLERAEGLLINFLDSDDKLELNCFSKIYAFFCSHRGETDVIAFPISYLGAPGKSNIQNHRFDAGTRLVDLNSAWDITHTFVTAACIMTEAAKQYSFDEHLRFSEDCCFIQKILLRKETLGLVAGTAYYYRIREDGSSATQQNTFRKEWYLPVIKYYTEELVKESIRRKGCIPLYIQNNLMYDLQWRINIDSIPDGVLTEEEHEEYAARVQNVVRQMDDLVIERSARLRREYKDVLIYRDKSQILPEFYGNDIGLSVNSKAICKLSNSPTVLQTISFIDGACVLSGEINVTDLLALPYEAGLRVNDNFVPFSQVETVDKASSCGIVSAKRHIFSASVPLANSPQKIGFALKVQDTVVPLKTSFPYPCPMGGVGSMCVSSKGMRLYYDAGKLVLIKASAKKEEDLRHTLYKHLSNSTMEGARKAVMIRKLLPFLARFKTRPLYIVQVDRTDLEGASACVASLRQEKKAKIVPVSAIKIENAISGKKVCLLDSKKYKWLFLLSDRVYYKTVSETNPFPRRDIPYRDLLFSKQFIDYASQKRSNRA